MRNFKIVLDTSGTLAENVKLQYLHTLICVEALRQFDNLCAQVVSITIVHLNQVILGLGTYFFPVNALSK